MYGADRDSTKECSSCQEHDSNGTVARQCHGYQTSCLLPSLWSGTIVRGAFSLPQQRFGRETRPAQRLDGGGLERRSEHRIPRERHQRRGRRRGRLLECPRASGRFYGMLPAKPSTSISWRMALAMGINETQQVVGESGGDAAYWESVNSPALILPPVAGDGAFGVRAERPGSHCWLFRQLHDLSRCMARREWGGDRFPAVPGGGARPVTSPTMTTTAWPLSWAERTSDLSPGRSSRGPMAALPW